MHTITIFWKSTNLHTRLVEIFFWKNFLVVRIFTTKIFFQKKISTSRNIRKLDFGAKSENLRNRFKGSDLSKIMDFTPFLDIKMLYLAIFWADMAKKIHFFDYFCSVKWFKTILKWFGSVFREIQKKGIFLMISGPKSVNCDDDYGQRPSVTGSHRPEFQNFQVKTH